MSREEIHKLVGGYATGSLTPQEQEVLFAAALEDQELFDVLAREQALRDLLSDPAARAEVLAAVAERPRRWSDPRRWYEVLGRVRPWGPAAAMAALAVLVVVVWRQSHTGGVFTPPPMLSQVQPAERSALPLPVVPAQAPPAATATVRPPKQLRKPAAKTPVAPDNSESTLSLAAPPPPPPAMAPRAAPAPAAAPLPIPAPLPQTVTVDGVPAGDRAARGAPVVQGAQGAQVVQGRVMQPLNAPVSSNAMLQADAAPKAAAGGGRGGAGGGGGVLARSAVQLYNQASGQSIGAVGGIMAFREATPPPIVALRYNFLTRTAAGESLLSNPAQLKPGETLEIQFTPAADGILTLVPQDGGAVTAVPVVRLQPTIVPVAEGTQQLEVTYSLQRPIARTAMAQAQEAASGGPPPLVTENLGGITYVGSRTGQNQIRFTVKVK